jgi:hypothetical protein
MDVMVGYDVRYPPRLVDTKYVGDAIHVLIS